MPADRMFTFSQAKSTLRMNNARNPNIFSDETAPFASCILACAFKKKVDIADGPSAPVFVLRPELRVAGFEATNHY